MFMEYHDSTLWLCFTDTLGGIEIKNFLLGKFTIIKVMVDVVELSILSTFDFVVVYMKLRGCVFFDVLFATTSSGCRSAWGKCFG